MSDEKGDVLAETGLRQQKRQKETSHPLIKKQFKL